MPGTPPFAEISAGWEHSCAVTAAGAAYCWGNRLGGQLGDGTRTTRVVPTRVP
jgi:alpha-tubulin suppressor-like RCC1 family protein